MQTFRGTAVVALAAVLLFAATAQAQTLTTSPAEPRQWDIAAHTGWLGGNKDDVAVEWNDWSDTWFGGLSAGRYITPHLKAEIHAVFAQRARLDGEGVLVPSGGLYPIYQYREHYFTTSSAGAGIAYQFGTNRWFHPHVGIGVDAIREHHRNQVPQQLVPGRNPPLVLPASVTDTVTWAARPYATAGFKLYLSERAFMRSDIATSFFGRGIAYASWSAGIGVDL
jgi:outer membrane protein W